jgi:glycosyltransferase involved in cell wall biosynthesis
VDLASELARLCTVTFLLPEGSESARRLPEGLGAVYYLPEGSRRNPLTLWRLRRMIREIGPDVVNTHAEKATEMVWWVGLTTPIRHVASKHNVRRRRIFDRIEHVTGVSQAVADGVRGRRPATVIHNATNAQPVCPREKPAVFTMVSIARLHHWKGNDILIRAVAKLEFPFRLLIAGEGPDRFWLEGLIRELELEDRVELLGHREDVPELLATAHLQVQTSRSEGFGLVLLEGLVNADLVLSTPTGAVAELFPDEFLMDPEDVSGALTRAHDDYEGMVTRFAAVKEHHRDRFTWSGIAQQYVDAFQRALADG